MTNHVIEAAGLTKFYGSRRGIVDVDFAVDEGEAFGFLGPNGAGKTTTIRLALGFLRATRGEIRVFGEPAFEQAARIHANVAYLGSDPGFLGELTGAEQLDYLASMRGLAKGAWRPLAERLELDPTVRIKRLSRGNRQKIGVVSAFMGQAPLLVLDSRPAARPVDAARVPGAGRGGAGGRTTLFLSSHTWSRWSGPATGSRSSATPDVDVSSVGEAAGRPLAVGQPGAVGAAGARCVRPAERRGRGDDRREVHLMVQVTWIRCSTGSPPPGPGHRDHRRRTWRTCSCATTARTTAARPPADTAAAGNGSGAAAGNGSAHLRALDREEVS
jgi:ABC-type transport system involved in cytochrome c biogenesis ATPase subunit